MCIRICYEIDACVKREVCASDSKSMVLGICHVYVSAAHHINVTSPQNAENGDPKIQPIFVSI